MGETPWRFKSSHPHSHFPWPEPDISISEQPVSCGSVADHPRELFIAGTGSFALEVAEYAQAAGRPASGLVELIDPARVGSEIHGLDVVALSDERRSGGEVVIGTGGERLGYWEVLAEHGWRPATVVHPTAQISLSAAVGDGVVVGPGAIVGAASQLGPHVLVGRGALVGHHVRIGAGATLNPGVNIAGNAVIGEAGCNRHGCRHQQPRRGRPGSPRGRRRSGHSAGRSRDARSGCSGTRVFPTMIGRVRRRLAHVLDRRFFALHERVEDLATRVEDLARPAAATGDDELRNEVADIAAALRSIAGTEAEHTRLLRAITSRLDEEIAPALRIMAGNDAENRRLLDAARRDPEYELAFEETEPLVTVIVPTHRRP